MSSPFPQYPIGKPWRLPVSNPRDKNYPWDTIRVVASPAVIIPAPVEAAGVADASSFKPLRAVYIRPEVYNPNDVDTACGGIYTSFANDLMSRVSIWINAFQPASAPYDGFPSAPTQAVPNAIDFQVRVSADTIPEAVWQGQVKTPNWNEKGLLVALNAFQGTQIEVWGRVTNLDGAAQPVAVSLQFCIDNQQSFSGSPVAVDNVAGRMVTVTKVQFMP
jgi:hypothetical protein